MPSSTSSGIERARSSKFSCSARARTQASRAALVDVAAVRCGDDGARAVSIGCNGHLDRLRHRGRAVVNPGQYVAVQIEHRVAQVGGGLRSDSLRAGGQEASTDASDSRR